MSSNKKKSSAKKSETKIISSPVSSPVSMPSNIIQNGFSNRNVLFKFVASLNTGNIRDKALTAETTAKHNVNGKKLSVRKYIMQGDKLNAVVSAIQAARIYLNRATLPWQDEGIRIVPAPKVIDLKVEMEKRIRDIIQKREDLVSALDEIIAKDKVELNGTFNADDYPTADELREKFGARVEVRPVSVDFRVTGIEDAAQKEIQTQVAAQVETAVKTAKAYQAGQIVESIQHLVTRLTEKKLNGDMMGFKGTSIQNIMDTCASVRDLALDDDTAFQAIADSIKSTFGKFDADKIREDKVAREEAAATAKAELNKIQDAMSAFMGDRPGNKRNTPFATSRTVSGEE